MFEFRCPLRWSDLDAQGHVNNAVIVDYLQEARVAFFRSGPASGMLESGVVVVRHQVEYRAPIDYSDAGLDISLSVVAVGGARFELAYDLRQGGRLAARARSVLCPFDFVAGRPVRLEPAVREFLTANLAELDALRDLEAPHLDGQGTVTDLFVRWSDLDSFAHVNNAKTYDYLQQARVTATSGWDPTMARVGTAGSQFLWLVARQDVDYVAQLQHRVPPYAVRTAPTRLGSTSVTLASEIFDQDSGEVFARARTILVCADLELRPTALPAPTREALEQRLARP